MNGVERWKTGHRREHLLKSDTIMMCGIQTRDRSIIKRPKGRGNFLAAVCEAAITMKGKKEGYTNWDTFRVRLAGPFKRIRGVGSFTTRGPIEDSKAGWNKHPPGIQLERFDQRSFTLLFWPSFFPSFPPTMARRRASLSTFPSITMQEASSLQAAVDFPFPPSFSSRPPSDSPTRRAARLQVAHPIA